MSSVNLAIVLGHVGKDPEIRYTQGGDAVANLSIATTEKWKDKQGEKQEKTEWHRLVVFGRTAEVVEKYVRKGSLIHVTGRLQTREWEKDGVKRYSTEIVVDRLQLCGEARGARQNDDSATSDDQHETQTAKAQPAQRQPARQADIDDDIPF